MHRLALSRGAATGWGTPPYTAAVYLTRLASSAASSTVGLSAHSSSSSAPRLLCPSALVQQPVRYASTRSRNTQGSNEQRKKKSADRRERSGALHAQPSDLPIQSVTDPAAYAALRQAQLQQQQTTAQGLDTRFPAFGKKYKPVGYDAILRKAQHPSSVPLPPGLFDDDAKKDQDADAPFQGSTTIDYARPPSTRPSGASASPAQPAQGGAFGRADAYRVPGERYGGSYKKAAAYGTDDVKARAQSEEEEQEALEKRWAEEDRRKEELAARGEKAPTAGGLQSKAASAVPQRAASAAPTPATSTPPTSSPAIKPAASSQQQTEEQKRIAAMWAAQDAETAREQGALRRKLGAPEIPQVKAKAPAKNAPVGPSAPRVVPAAQSAKAPAAAAPVTKAAPVMPVSAPSAAQQTAEQKRIADMWAAQDAATAREQAGLRRKLNAPEIPRVPVAAAAVTAAPPAPVAAAVVPPTVAPTAGGSPTAPDAQPFLAPPAAAVDAARTRFYDDDLPSSRGLPSRPSAMMTSTSEVKAKKIPKGGRQAKKLKEQAERERLEQEAIRAVEERREGLIRAAGGDPMPPSASTDATTAVAVDPIAPTPIPHVDPDTEFSLAHPPAFMLRTTKFQKRPELLAAEEEAHRAVDHHPLDGHVPLSSAVAGGSTNSLVSSPPPPLSATICCGCGAAFQSSFLDAPGFLPQETIDKYRRKRMELYEAKVEIERKKQDMAAMKEEARRLAQGKGTAGASAQQETITPIEGTIDVEATASSAEPLLPAGGTPSTPPTTPFTLRPDFHTLSRLDPSKPLAAQDLTRALNKGLLGDTQEDLIAAGIDPELVMSKKELSQREREEREQRKELRGESALRCLRCFQLAHYGYTRGQVASVRAEDFRTLLRSRFMERGGRSSVILKVVDIVDFHGSFLRNFSAVVGGRNPIILVANKIDLLPSGYGENRLRAWIKAEAAKYGLHFHSIELVSAETGAGLYKLSQAAAELADPDPLHDRPRRDIYIVGATNVGKSSIVNKLIEKRILTSKGQFEATKIRTADSEREEKEKNLAAAAAAGGDGKAADSIDSSSGPYLSASSFMSGVPGASSSASAGAPSSAELLHQSFNVLGGKMTSSIIPGTTLGMVSFPYLQEYDRVTGKKKEGAQHVLYDTPGVINEEQLSHLLTYHELREVMPRRQIQPLTYRLTRGQCLLLGGLARLDFVEGERDYCFFTVFAARTVTVHITQIDKMDEIQQKAVKPTPTPAATEGSDTTPEATATESTAEASTSTTSLLTPAASPPVAGQVGYLDFIARHGGSLIYPPFTPERCLQLGLHTGTRVLFEVHGRGWLEACEDVVYPGLGWISVTGSGQMKLRGILPGATKAYAREPLMPFEAQKTMRKFSGSGTRQH